MEAEISLEYECAKEADAVADAVSPDNFKTPSGLSIQTRSKECRVVTIIECKGRIQTFIATIDDLLFCVATAESTIRTAKSLGGNCLSRAQSRME